MKGRSVTGTVLEVLPRALYRVAVEGGREVVIGVAEIASIFPFRTPTKRVASRPDSGSITRPLAITTSYVAWACTLAGPRSDSAKTASTVDFMSKP